ncbi:TonB-dependent receptor [Rapidithrix thailandica]|uniref:TonB-dependent receptor n=1 Tax=Rapidithrix thailandica TaxID=413964 RepID=A0AAW9S9J4_9BACT
MKWKLLRQIVIMSRYALCGLLLQLFLYGFLLAKEGNAQEYKRLENIYLSLEVQDMPLKKVFHKISLQTNLYFTYNRDLVKDDQKVSIDIGYCSLDQLLGRLSGKYHLGFKRINENIFVRKLPQNQYPVEDMTGRKLEKVRVSGTVTSEEGGEPLPGVSILVKGTSLGTTTDVNGQYNIQVEVGLVLQFSFIGYVTQELSIGTQTVIDLEMVPDVSQLEEVVVVGYGALKKESITGSVVRVNKELLRKSTAPNVSTALIGKMAGITSRHTDGRPGSATSIQIRNMGTPLYVIDGIQKDEEQFNNLDVNDIESVTVLKDASAAIYGIKASNGVVLVTTKRGKRGEENQVNINIYTGVQAWTRFPKFANAAQYVEGQIESDLNRFGETNWTPEDLGKWREGTEEGYRGFDWYDFGVNRLAPMTHANLNTSGGSEKINYYLSASYVNQEGSFEGFNFKRFNIQNNISGEIVNRLTIGTQINARVETRKNPGLPWFDDLTFPLWALFRNRPTERPFANDNPEYPADNGPRTAFNYALMSYEKSGYLKNRWRVFHGNLNAEYILPLDGLKVKTLYSYYFAQQHADVHEYAYDAYTYDRENDVYNRTGGNDNPYRDRDVQYIEENMLQSQLNYDKAFGKHAVSAVVAFEMTERQEPGFWIRANPASKYLDLIKTDEFQEIQDRYTESARMGFAARFNYNFSDKYILEIAGRYDGSWKFPKGKRWGLFPSLSVGYRMSEEVFFKEALGRVISDLKLRASIGKLGDDNVGIGNFDYIPGYNYGQGMAIFDGRTVTGIQARGLPVTGVSWIETINMNIGLDFSLWEGKLSGSIDYFKRKREGLTAVRNDVVIPNEIGISLPKENLESDMNTGFDAALNYTHHFAEFKYSIGANFTLARHKFLEVYKPRFGSSWHHYRNGTEDRWTNINWGYESIGQFQSQEEINNYPVDVDGKGNSTLLPGDIIYKDHNNDGIINTLDQRPIGYGAGLPLINFGINLGAEWKGFDVSVLLQGAGKYQVTLNSEMRQPFLGGGNVPVELMDRWHRKDLFDPNSAWVAGKYPSIRQDGLPSNNRHSDFWLKNVNYLRLRTLELGYTFSKKYLEKVKLEKVRVYANGFNLLTLDNLKVLDPEVSAGNGRMYPQSVAVNLGVNLTF